MVGAAAGYKTLQNAYVAISDSVRTPFPSPVTSAKKRADGVARKVRLDRASPRVQSVNPISIPSSRGPAGLVEMPTVPEVGRCIGRSPSHVVTGSQIHARTTRSEERRVGKEWKIEEGGGE